MCVEGGDGEPSKFVEICSNQKNFLWTERQALLDRFRRDNLKNERFFSKFTKVSARLKQLRSIGNKDAYIQQRLVLKFFII